MIDTAVMQHSHPEESPAQVTPDTLSLPQSNYDKHEVQKQLELFESKHERDTIFSSHSCDSRLAFIVQAAATKLLYSPDVLKCMKQKMQTEALESGNQVLRIERSNFSVEFLANLQLQRTLKLDTERSLRSIDEDFSFLGQIFFQYPDEVLVKIESVKNYRFIVEKVFFTRGVLSYPKILETVIPDNDDCHDMIELFRNSASKMNENIAALHYLIFGLETLRNPSSLIYNMMLFDLKRVGKISWNELFQLMPLRVHHAVMASRFFNDCYSPYMPANYRYDSWSFDESTFNYGYDWTREINDAIGGLLKDAIQIIHMWLRMKFESNSEYSQYIGIYSEILSGRENKIFFDLLEQAILEWFTIDLKQREDSPDPKCDSRPRA